MADEMNPKRFPPPLPPTGMKLPAGLPLKIPAAPPGLRTPSFPPAGMPPPRPVSQPPSGFSDSSASSDSARKLEERNKELEEAKRKLERTVAEMDLKIKEEKEKSLTLVIKAREEESLSLKMEQALKEMQDKTRIARREQELDDARSKAEEKVKELERRLNEERETWVINMKKQMEMRDSETTQIESQMELRYRDLEKRWIEEKNALNTMVRKKEEELSQMKAASIETQAQARRNQEETARALELERGKLEQKFESARDGWVLEKRQILDRLDGRERELVALKAQLAMIDSQVRAAQEASARNAQEKERTWQLQINDIQRDFQSLKQLKDQLQAQFFQVTAEVENLKKRDLEWEKKENQWSLREQELKNSVFQKDLVEKRYASDQSDWARKMEDWHTAEHSRQSEVASLKSDLAQLEQKLESRYEKEKRELLSQTELRLQDEIRLKAEMMDRELTAIRESMAKDLSALDEEIDEEKAAFRAELSRKETELAAAAGSMKDMQRELVAAVNAVKEMQRELSSERERAEKSEAELQISRGELEKAAESIQKLREERLEPIREAAFQKTSPPSLPGRIWKYLNRTVIVLSFRGVPRNGE